MQSPPKTIEEAIKAGGIPLTFDAALEMGGTADDTSIQASPVPPSQQPVPQSVTDISQAPRIPAPNTQMRMTDESGPQYGAGQIYQGIGEAATKLNNLPREFGSMLINKAKSQSSAAKARSKSRVGMAPQEWMVDRLKQDASGVGEFFVDLASLVSSPVSGMVSGFRNPTPKTAGGVLLNAASGALGGDVDEANRNWMEGKYGKWAADMFTLPVAGIAAGRLAKDMGKSRIPVEATKTRQQINSLAALTGSRARLGTTPQSIATHSVDLIKQAAKKLGLDPSKEYSWSSKASFPTRERAPQSDVMGNLMRGGTQNQVGRAAEVVFDPDTKTVGKNPAKMKHMAIEVMDEAARMAYEPIETTINAYSKEPLTPQLKSAIKSDLETAAQKLDKLKDPESRSMAARIRTHSSSIDKAGTIGELNNLKVFANKQLDQIYSIGRPGQAVAIDAKAIATTREFANAVKRHLYPELKRLGGDELGPYLERESYIIQARDGLYETFYDTTSPAQAQRFKMSFPEYVMEGQGGNEASPFIRRLALRGTGISRSPMGDFNLSFRRAIGELGNDMVPGSSKVTIPDRKLLAGDKFKFRITGDAPLATLSQIDVTDAKGLPLPTRRTGLDYARNDKQYYGKSDITRPTDEMQNWQYTSDTSTTGPSNPASGPTRKPAGPGTLITTDPRVVETTIQSISKTIDDAARGVSKLTPKEVRQLQIIQADLVKQLEQYQSGLAGQTPRRVTLNPGSIGTVERGGIPAAVRYPAAAIAGSVNGEINNK